MTPPFDSRRCVWGKNKPTSVYIRTIFTAHHCNGIGREMFQYVLSCSFHNLYNAVLQIPNLYYSKYDDKLELPVTTIDNCLCMCVAYGLLDNVLCSWVRVCILTHVYLKVTPKFKFKYGWKLSHLDQKIY